MTGPALSVVIPTRNRCAILTLTLSALESQEGISDLLEVIVVDDGSTDDTARMLHRERFSGIELKSLVLEPGGPARARNCGIAKTRAERVLLLGDDTVPAPGALASHLKAAGHRKVAVQGLIEWDPQIGVSREMKFLAPEGPQFWFKGLGDDSPVPWNSVASSNLSAPQRWFLEEPFDEVFSEACFEDTEMAWRWARRGWSTVFCKSAVCYHRHRYESIEPFLARQRKAGWWARKAARMHPGMLATTLVRPLALAPAFAARAGWRALRGRARQEDLWDLRCRLEFAKGFLSRLPPSGRHF